MTDHSDLIAKLRACATARTGENPYQMLSQAADALSSQSLSLSEARAENDRKDLEIERLRADIAVKAKLLTKSAKETRAFWDALIPKGGRCRDCADFDGRCQGDGPPCDPQAHAFENLAKLQAASPDLSSLRKGAEVAVKPLKWKRRRRGCDDRYVETDVGEYCVGLVHSSFVAIRRSIKDGQLHDEVLQRGLGLETAKSAAQSDFETRIRSALVSGSREEQVDG